MAETQTESSMAGDSSSKDRRRGIRNAPPPPALQKSVPIAQRKRQRLDRVLDKIASQVAVFSGHGKSFDSSTDVFQLANPTSHQLKKKVPQSIKVDRALPDLVRIQALLPGLDSRLLDSPTETMEESPLIVSTSLAPTGGSAGSVITSTSANNNNSMVDTIIDQERYYYGAISEEEENVAGDDLSEEDVFSPHSISSERSPLSPSGTADSPYDDTVRAETSTPRGQSTLCLTPGSNHSAPGYHCKKCFPSTFQDHMESPDCHRHLHTSSPGLPPSPLSPATPNTPLLASQGFATGMTFPAASPLHSLEFLLQARYMEDLSRRRAHSDSDLQTWYDATLLPQHQPLHSGARGRLATPDSPLDLSLRRSTSSTSSESPGLSTLGPYSPGVSSFGVTPTGPLVGMEVACVCPICGQMFALHDRLAKHMASRHKSKSRTSLESAVTRAYLCDICHRPFARSDMLTRHMRLHTGLKPYTCRVCGQVFSRSDHLSTHQRTHTGEKPYRCPQCPYAACRRDMITRHLRTHSRGETGTVGGSTPQVHYLNTDIGPSETMEDPASLPSTTVQLALPPTGRSRGRRTRNRPSEMLARSLSAEDVPFQDSSDISFHTPSPR
nr:EOG090X0G73 [Triops cancriformis]